MLTQKYHYTANEKNNNNKKQTKQKKKQQKKQQKNQQKTQQQQNKSIHSCKLQCVLKPNIVIKYTFYS